MDRIDNIPVLMKIPPDVPWTNGILSMEKNQFSSKKINSNVFTNSGTISGSISDYTDNTCVRQYSKSKSLLYKPNRIDLLETNRGLTTGSSPKKELNCSLSVKSKEDYNQVISFLQSNGVPMSNICSRGGKKKHMTKKRMRTTKRKYRIKRKQRRKSLRRGKAKPSNTNIKYTRAKRSIKIKRKETRNLPYQKKKGKFKYYTKKKY